MPWRNIYCRYIFRHYAYLLYSTSNTKSVWYAFIAISTHNWIRFRKTNLPILSVWLISMIGRKELFCFLIALLVYHWPSVVFFLKIFPNWLPLMSFLSLFMLIDVSNTQKITLMLIKLVLYMECNIYYKNGCINMRT